MESLNLAAPEFLIRLNGEYFLAELDGSTVTGTPVPSAAAHFSYSAADKLCDRLRQRGYPQVHATDIIGNPITREMLRA